MKKIFLSLMVFMMAFAAVISFTSCGPTAGLEEISYEDLANAKLSGTYTCTTKTTVYKSDGSKDVKTTEPTSLSAEALKIAVAANKVSVDLLKKASPKSSGKVCANSNYTKIVTYIYTRDDDGKLQSEFVATYKKN